MSFRTKTLSIFPLPSVVAMPSAGIDISNNSIKCVVLKKSSLGLRVQSFNENSLQSGIVIDGDIEKHTAIVDILRSYRLRHGVRYAVASIPEKKAYLYQTLIPVGESDLRSGVEFGLEAHVPLPAKDMVFDFEVVRNVQAGTVVAVTAYAKRVVDAYTKAFKDSGIVLRSLEVESQALARAVLNADDRAGVVMIVDLGRQTTRIAIADGGVVSFTSSIDVGGDALTEVITKKLSISSDDAEKIKKERGLLMSIENTDVVEALMITMSVLKDEIMRHLSDWGTLSAEGVTRLPIDKIIVCGGNANIRGFSEYLESFTSVPVVVANVWTNAFPLDTYIPPMGFQESLEYATAIGLALRGSNIQQW